jgi:hypothetical protein
LLSTRLKNQKLTASSLRTPEAVVSWLGAMQAQDYAGAKWAIGLRAPTLADADIERAFTDGRILRTHVLRPTWHFVTPPDIRWMLALTGPRVQRINRGYARTLGLDDRTMNRARDVVERALTDEKLMTREALSLALGRARIDARGQRLAHLVMDLELQGVTCSGPRQGKQFTYALISDRAPAAPQLTRDEALAELTRRYFQSRGPATLRDFMWWSGLTMRDAKAGAALADVDVLVSAPGPDRVKDAHYLLPNYDEYLIAYRDRGAVIDPARARNLGVFTSREFPHHVILDGRVAGSWRRRITAQTVTVDVAPYGKLSRVQAAAVGAGAARYARFLGLQGEVRLDG